MTPDVGKNPLRNRAVTTTRWSVIVSGATQDPDDQKAHGALAQRCRIYWRPVFPCVCRRHHSLVEAQDLVAGTVDDSADVDDEIRHLCAALGIAEE